MPSPTSPRRKWPIYALILAGVFLLGWYYIYERPGRLALARWTEIGRPMPEFEKTIQPLEENDSLRELMKDLQPLGFSSFYNTESFDYTRYSSAPTPSFDFADEIIPLMGINRSRYGDAVEPLTQPTPFLDAHNDELGLIYRRIIAREIPVFDVDLQEGPGRKRPEYITLRAMAQMFAADAHYRLARGDTDGAANAMKALSRVVRSLDKDPRLTGQMIAIAIQGIATSAEARLPEEPNRWEALPSEVERSRENFRRAIQMGAWDRLHWSSIQPRPAMTGWLAKLPTWITRVGLPYRVSPRTGGAWEALAEAGTVEITKDASQLSKSDFGAKNFAEAQSSSLLSTNYYRAWLRLHFTLLTREQVALLRMTRTKLYAGEEMKAAEFPSAVVSGAHWTVTADRATWTATFQLNAIPAWAQDTSIAPPSYWLLPLDGSQCWQFAPP